MPKADTKAKATKSPKQLTPYNKFMKDHLSDWKKNNPGKTHKEAFVAVAALWKDSPENPKNKK